MISENRPHEGLPTGAFRPEGEEGALLDGRYRLGDLIGRGGTAEVYRGRDELLGRDVAVKVFDLQLTDLNTVARQRSEMRALAALSDPHLIAVHDARLVESSSGSAAPERSYLIMELVNGGTLAERLHAGPMEPSVLTPIAIAVASGLAAAHEHGLVHRDVKPANVLIAESGAVKLGDFGLARMVATDSRLTSGSMLAGTAAYFSPEQAGGEHVGAPTDIYAFGLVLLEALSGRREFPGAPVPSAMARLLRDPEIPDGLPAPWPTLLLRMTDRDPAVRPTAADVVRILSGAAEPVAPVPADASASRPAGPLPALPSGSPERRDEPVTAAGSSVLSAFLRPEGEEARRARRRTSVLVGAGALLSAVVLTVVITVAGENSPPADASTVVVESDAGDAVSTRSPAVRTTAGTVPTSRTSGALTSGRTAGPGTAGSRSAGTPAGSVRTTPVRSAAATPLTTSTAPAVVVVRATATPATTRTSAPATRSSTTAPVAAVQAPPSPAAGNKSAANDAAARDAAAASRSAEKAAEAARKAAEKQQREAAKNAPGAGKPGKPGKKP